MPYVSTRKAVELLNLCPNTLRKYADTGKINVIKDLAGRRRYDVETFLHKGPNPEIIGYARFSSYKQKDDLLRQVEYIRSIYPSIEVIQDVGSGLNFKRKGLRTLLGRILQGCKFQLVVAHKDRLARFGSELIRFLLEQNGGSLVVLLQDIGEPEEAELTGDLLAILHHFSCRMHGKRSHKSSKSSSVPNTPTKSDTTSMVENLKVHLQQNHRVSKRGGDKATLDGSKA